MKLQKQLLGLCENGDARDVLCTTGVYDECYEASHWDTLSFTPRAVSSEFWEVNTRRTIQEYFK